MSIVKQIVNNSMYSWPFPDLTEKKKKKRTAKTKQKKNWNLCGWLRKLKLWNQQKVLIELIVLETKLFMWTV